MISLKAMQFAEAKKRGKPYEAAGERGFIYRGRCWVSEEWTAPIKGEKFRGTCDCTNPPWEECQHGV